MYRRDAAALTFFPIGEKKVTFGGECAACPVLGVGRGAGEGGLRWGFVVKGVFGMGG